MTSKKIIQTLKTYDTERTTITIGSAAIAINLAKIGIDDFPIEDVDVLCSDDFFARQNADILNAEPDTIQKFQIRFPFGGEHIRARSPILDIYPGEKTSESILPFSASTELGGLWHPMTYQYCISQPDKIIKHAGYMFLTMAELLLWATKAGREKDIAKVDALLPLSLEHQLITDAQYQTIKAERDMSVKLRKQHPHRHYARVEP